MHKFEASLYYIRAHLPKPLKVISALNHMLFILKYFFEEISVYY